MFFQKPIVERLKPHFNFKIAILFGASYFMLGNHNVFFLTPSLAFSLAEAQPAEKKGRANVLEFSVFF